MGKREEKKKLTNQKILEVSKKIFREIGYEDAKTSMIAKEVGIAEGTIFNYFDSKAEILVAIIGEHFIMEDYKFNFNLKEKEDVKEEINRALEYYLSNVDIVDKGLLKVLFATITLKGNESKQIFNVLKMADDKVIGNVRSFIEHVYNHKSIDEIDIIVRIIYANMMLSFVEYITEENMTVEDLVENINKTTEFIL